MLGPEGAAAMLLAGLAAGNMAGVTLGWAQAPLLMGLGALCAAVAWIDARHFLIPDLLVLAIAGLGLAGAGLAAPSVASRIATMAALFVLLWLLRLVLSAWKGQTALGMGDVKFLTAAAAWLPIETLPAYVFLSACSGLVEVAWRHPGHDRIAFGRHLAPWLVACVLAAPWLPVAFALG